MQNQIVCQIKTHCRLVRFHKIKKQQKAKKLDLLVYLRSESKSRCLCISADQCGFWRTQACFSRAPESRPLFAELYKHQGQRLALFFLLFWLAVHQQTGGVSTHFLLTVNCTTSYLLLFVIKLQWDQIWRCIYLPSKQNVYCILFQLLSVEPAVQLSMGSYQHPPVPDQYKGLTPHCMLFLTCGSHFILKH